VTDAQRMEQVRELARGIWPIKQTAVFVDQWRAGVIEVLQPEPFRSSSELVIIHHQHALVMLEAALRAAPRCP